MFQRRKITLNNKKKEKKCRLHYLIITGKYGYESIIIEMYALFFEHDYFVIHSLLIQVVQQCVQVSMDPLEVHELVLFHHYH